MSELGRSRGHMANVLVTGAAGFAGSHLVEHLAGLDDVVAWARAEPPPGLAHLGHWQQVDLLDRGRVREAVRKLRPSVVYHCAGSPHVAGSWDDRVVPFETNVLATHYLLDALRRAGTGGRVLLAGSAHVYLPSDVPLTEEAPVAPGSPYALSKLVQEELSLRAAEEDGLEIVVARSFNHIGPRQSDAFMAAAFARQVANIERGGCEPVLRVGNLDARRDVTDVRDVVRAYTLIATAGTSGAIYNVASGRARPVRWLLDELIARARVPVRVEIDPDRLRPSDVPVLVGDASKLRAATGWVPEITIEQTLDDLLAYWRTRLAEPGEVDGVAAASGR